MLTAVPCSCADQGLMLIDQNGFVPTALLERNLTLRTGSAAGRAILHAPGVSMPGVFAMQRGCRARAGRHRGIETAEEIAEEEERFTAPAEAEEHASVMVIRPEK